MNNYQKKQAYTNAPLVGWECPIDGTRLISGYSGFRGYALERCFTCGHPMRIRGAKPWDQAKVDAAEAAYRRATQRNL